MDKVRFSTATSVPLAAKANPLEQQRRVVASASKQKHLGGLVGLASGAGDGDGLAKCKQVVDSLS